MSKRGRIGMLGLLAGVMSGLGGYDRRVGRSVVVDYKPLSIPKGLSEFRYEKGTVWALNKQNADKKALRTGLGKPV